MNNRLGTLIKIALLASASAQAQSYSAGSVQCRIDAISGYVNCSGQQTPIAQRSLAEVLLDTAATTSAIERNRAIAEAMRAQADLLRTQAQQQAKAAAMDRVVSLIGAADKVEGEAREALLKIAADELRKLYPATSFPRGSLVLVPQSDDGWDRMACERIKIQFPNLILFQGTFTDAASLSGVKLLVVNMMPDPNHDTMEVFLLNEDGQRAWSEKVGFAWTLNPERQTIKLADRMASKLKGRI